MALARIITRSQMCSRELALVLLARGYTVEIVSPDKVPDNIADLELRVDAGPANELIANVEAHDGERTTYLEFVHQLRAPVVDFLRRPSDLGEAAHISGEPVSLRTRPGSENMGLPAEVPQPSPRGVSPAAETLPPREANPEIDPEEGACPITPQVSPPKDPSGYFAVEDAAVPQPAPIHRTIIKRTIVPPTQAAQRRNRSAGWPWRAGLAFASLVLLAMVLGFSMRGDSKAAALSSDALPVEGIAAPTGVNPLSAIGAEKDLMRDPGPILAVPWGAPAADSEANSSHGLKEAQVAKSGTPATNPKAAVLRKRGDDLIARDTTIYFDKRFEPAPNAKRAKPITRHRGDRSEHH